jgi:cell division protein FtsQ
VFAVLAVWITAFSPVLGVRSVQVRGNRLLTQAEVRSAAAVKHGAPLLRLDTAAIARRVEQLPEVKSATVDTHLPNTVTVTVVERAAVGFIQKADDAFVLVDAEGTQFRTVKLRPRRLPLLVLPGGAQASPSSAAVATVAGDLDAGLLSRIQSIQALDPTAITLVLTDGRVVRWGSVARSADKARLLPALLAQPGTQFDVSNPDLVVSR